MGSNEASNQPVVHKFGDEELTDGTFIVGEEEFKCHKMTLACRSSYFKAMFFSNFKEKEQDKVSIEADPLAFRRLMEIIYAEKYDQWDSLVKCDRAPNISYCKPCSGDPFGADYVYKGCQPVHTLWQQCTALLKLADQFDLLSHTVSAMETYFLRGGNDCKCRGINCTRSGVKFIIALMYGMNIIKINSGASKIAVQRGIDAIKEVQSTLTLDIDHFKLLMNLE